MADTNCDIKLAGHWTENNCKLLCHNANWTDVLVFYVGNYLAHVATVITIPGESLGGKLITFATALFFPTAGLYLGLQAITSRAVLAPTALQKAARSGALCMVRPVPRNEFVYKKGKFGSRWVEVPEEEKGEDENLDEGVELGRVDEVEGEGEGDGQTQPLVPSVQAEGDVERVGSPPQDDAASLGRTSQSATNGNNDAGTGVQQTSSARSVASERSEEDPGSQTPSEEFYYDEYRPIFCTPIHGRCILPAGYELGPVPADALFEDEDEEPEPWWKLKSLSRTIDPDLEIASNYNMIKIIISLGQLIFGIATLYRTRGEQINQFGYAAFGLTVTPYACMSLVNLCASLARPEYAAMFVVNSKLLDQIMQDHPDECYVTGTVGRITAQSEDTTLEHMREEGSHPLIKRERLLLKRMRKRNIEARKIIRQMRRQKTFPAKLKLQVQIWKLIAHNLRDTLEAWWNQQWAVLLCLILGAAVPILVIFGLTHFKAGSSTLAQRVWTMTWLCFGIVFGANFHFNRPYIGRFRGPPFKEDIGMTRQTLTFIVGSGAPAIGGFVVVGQMILQKGICTQLPDT